MHLDSEARGGASSAGYGLGLRPRGSYGSVTPKAARQPLWIGPLARLDALPPLMGWGLAALALRITRTGYDLGHGSGVPVASHHSLWIGHDGSRSHVRSTTTRRSWLRDALSGSASPSSHRGRAKRQSQKRQLREQGPDPADLTSLRSWRMGRDTLDVTWRDHQTRTIVAKPNAPALGAGNGSCHLDLLPMRRGGARRT